MQYFQFQLSKICSGKKAALMTALPTHCKLPTETVSVSDMVIGKGSFLEWTRKKFFAYVLLIFTQDTRGQHLTNFTGHIKKWFCKSCYLNCYLWCVRTRTCHVLSLIYVNQHSQHPKKNKKQPEIWKKVRRWQKIQWSR